MSVASGPYVATSGLLFGYDMGNPERSWEGAPTVNLVPNPYANWNGSNFVFGGYNYDATGTQTYTYVTNVSNPIGSPAVMQYTTGTTGYKYWAVQGTVATTGTHTFSYYARIVSGPAATSNLSNEQLWRSNGVDQAVTGNWNPTYTTNWVRYSTTGPCTGGTVLDYFPIHGSSIAAGYTIQYCGFQLELGTYATPFVNGTRSNTQSLLDLMSTTTLTTNNLTYNSDNTFNFAGGDATSTVTVPLSTAFNKLTGTIGMWVNPTSYSGSNGLFVNRDNNTANATDWFWIGSWDSANYFFFRLGDGTTCCNNDLVISPWSTVCPTNTWTYVTCSWLSGGESRIYTNGVLRASRAISAIPATNPSATGRIGLGHESPGSWNGKISTTQIYNRQLTEAEIVQNFNATRGRYGV